ncbi:MAG: GntR family transcriptional regulator [Burkholderiales bacterium]|nr:GntR family transcriptional regulator [Burkholderiales bacterium]
MDERSFKRLERPIALADQVYDALRERLRNGDIAAGQTLQEVPLATQLGVSRTPVREAMARLASEGLLASERRSFVVPRLTRRDIDDIYELRFLIEPAAMRRAAPLAADPARRAGIEAALADAAAAQRAGDAQGYRDAHMRWHAEWRALVPNRRMVRMIELYADHMQHIRALTLDSARVRTLVLRGMRRITEALARGDAERAASELLEHLLQARVEFIQAAGLGDAEAGDDAAGQDTGRSA